MSEASAGKRPGRCVPCKPESAHRVEREPKQGPGSFARSVSTVSTAHNAYNTFLDPLTWPLLGGGLKRTASVMPLWAFSGQLNLSYLPLAQRGIVKWLRRWQARILTRRLASTAC